MAVIAMIRVGNIFERTRMIRFRWLGWSLENQLHKNRLIMYPWQLGLPIGIRSVIIVRVGWWSRSCLVDVNPLLDGKCQVWCGVLNMVVTSSLQDLGPNMGVFVISSG